MQAIELLPGISQRSVSTERLEMAYLLAGEGQETLVLIHGNCSSSHFFQAFMVSLAQTGHYTLYAPDMRGYGLSETLPTDGTRGVRDFSDDLASLVKALGLPSFHLFGWSLGGNIVIQYTIDYPEMVRTLTLQATGSPFGFGGSKDAEGTPTWPDFAGSGGGTVNPDFAQRLGSGDRGNDAASPRTVMNTLYFKPPFQVAPAYEEMLVTALLTTKTTPGNYDTDMTASSNWPMVAPGTRGVNNALSPKYLNQAELVDIPRKPPILWVHGLDDQIVSDTSLLEFGYLGQIGAVPGWPGAEFYPPQPMKTQIRSVLARYEANGGRVQEAVLENCAHSPHLEKPVEMLQIVTAFLEKERTGEAR